MLKPARLPTTIIVFVVSATVLAAETTVYVTKTGEKYHSGSCRYLSKSRTPMSLDEAVKAGYGPCSRCSAPSNQDRSKPPESDSKAESTRSAPASSQCAATTKKGTRCKRKAASGSSYCWQHGG
jgi:hypothetical protein